MAQLRLGIVGSDNSHALGFARLANIEQRFGDDVRVSAISSSDREEAGLVANEAQIDEVVGGPDELLGRVQAAIIVDRDGGLHREHAEPLLAAGLPVLVDKPLATTVPDAAAILRRAQETGSLVTSYSSLRWCDGTRALKEQVPKLGTVRLAEVSGPCDIHSPYGGHFFYGIHLAEIALALVPGPVQRARVVESSGVTTAFLRREGGPVIVLHLLAPTEGGARAHFPFYALLMGTESHVEREIQTDPDLYQALGRFLDMVNSRQRPLSDQEMLEPVCVLEAIGRSLAAGGDEVAVGR